jgi:hypothetical protein
VERNARHAWSIQSTSPGTPVGVPGRGHSYPHQGYRSLSSLNPWLPSLHRSAVHRLKLLRILLD